MEYHFYIIEREVVLNLSPKAMGNGTQKNSFNIFDRLSFVIYIVTNDSIHYITDSDLLYIFSLYISNLCETETNALNLVYLWISH